MIIDTHCHAWTYWPYQPAVPDPDSRGRVEQLLNEMDLNGVARAMIVCARIDHNPDNNDYIAAAIQAHPDQLVQLVDLDSEWSDLYHTPGAASRLRSYAERWKIAGFTHYLKQEEDGTWLLEKEGQAVLETAAELRLIVSLCCYPHQQAAVREAARRIPELPILCHHMGFVRRGKGTDEESLAQVIESAEQPNIYLKASGFAYGATERTWDYPYPQVQRMFQHLYEAYGAERLCWGSDYPVVRFFMTYRQSLEALRTHSDFIPEDAMAKILGGNAARLLAWSQGA